MSKTAVTFYDKKSVITKVSNTAKLEGFNGSASGYLKELIFQAIQDNYTKPDASLGVAQGRLSINIDIEEKEQLDQYLQNKGIKNFNSFVKDVIEEYIK